MMPAKFGTQLRIRHDAKLRAQMALAAKNLDLIETSYAAIGAEFAEFARITMNEEPLGDYLRTVFPEPADKEDRRAMRFVAKCRTRARYLFEEGAGNQMDKDPWDTLGRLQRHNRIRRS